MQGDVLERTASLDTILKEVHPHFHQHPKNLYFMVLTQSCDLVPRGANGGCKAPYISIAPVRALDLVVERQISQQNNAQVKADLPVVEAKTKTKMSEFLSRLFNNNEQGYFFLDSSDTALPYDCVAFLNLSIAIKSDLHLKACLDSKILQLTDTFQAKLGWLVGQMYSRVGTPDWDGKKLKTKINTALDTAAIWIPDGQISSLEQSFQALVSTDASAQLSGNEISKLISKMPNRKKKVIGRVGEVISQALGANQSELAEKLRRQLDNDAALTALLK